MTTIMFWLDPGCLLTRKWNPQKVVRIVDLLLRKMLQHWLSVHCLCLVIGRWVWFIIFYVFEHTTIQKGRYKQGTVPVTEFMTWVFLMKLCLSSILGLGTSQNLQELATMSARLLLEDTPYSKMEANKLFFCLHVKLIANRWAWGRCLGLGGAEREASQACRYPWQPWERQPPGTVTLINQWKYLPNPHTYH